MTYFTAKSAPGRDVGRLDFAELARSDFVYAEDRALAKALFLAEIQDDDDGFDALVANLEDIEFCEDGGSADVPIHAGFGSIDASSAVRSNAGRVSSPGRFLLCKTAFCAALSRSYT